MLTDEAIAEQIFRALRQSVLRFGKPETMDECRRLAIAEYLSGAMQTATFLMAHDGGVLPHDVQRAIALVGKRLGYDLGQPRDPPL